MANAGRTPSPSSNGNLVDEFEAAFQNCLTVLTKEDSFSTQDREEVALSAEQSVAKFIEAARHLEQFFLQKRLLLSVQKPDQVIRDDINDMKSELVRKDELIKKHHEKIAAWQRVLQDIQRMPQSPSGADPGVQAPTSTMNNLPLPAVPPSMVQHRPMIPTGRGYPPPANLQGPLAYLEKSATNAGLQEPPR